MRLPNPFRDWLKLALRWAFNKYGAQIIAFAFFPTKKELDAAFDRIAAGWMADLQEAQKGQKDRKSLH